VFSENGQPIANAVIRVRNDTNGRYIDHDITSGELAEYCLHVLVYFFASVHQEEKHWTCSDHVVETPKVFLGTTVGVLLQLKAQSICVVKNILRQMS